ncbi:MULTISPECIES: hypothetical protein [Streptomyces]|uniref:Uncharacterized protein n=1 Tax=Streptomyces achmelvichensis TaxID=3134111 RepID=A0ACC6PLM6_9ACTN|nr:hypothetical protein [Streptomyces sp. NBC_00306]
MTKRSILATAVLTVGTAVLSVAPAQAGIVDGTLNNANVLDHVSALNSNINSDSQTTENNNANTRSDGMLNNAIGQHL